MTPFVSLADQGMYLAHAAGGQHAVMQGLWRYRRPVDMDGLTRFRDNLAHGRLARLIRPALLPFGRHQWVRARLPTSAISVQATPIDSSAMQAWVDAQVELPLDPALGPGWTLTFQPFTDGSTVVSLVVSHCIADGMAVALAVREAVQGERRPSSYPAWSPQRSAMSLAPEFLRSVQDAPATFRALAQLVRTARTMGKTPKPSPARTTADGRTVVFPSAFVRVPTSAWDERARSLGANRFSLLAALTAAFAESLGRIRSGDVTLVIPVNQREGLSDSEGNCFLLATLKVPAGEPRGRLHGLQRRLQTTLLRTRREPDPLATLLPLVPYVPKRAFLAAYDLALGGLADMPVTCSYLGELPPDVLRVDGTVADRCCFRGVDRNVDVSAIEARHGVASLLACVISDFLILNFVAYQPGVVTESRHLLALIDRLLAYYGLTGAFFDA